MIRTVNKHIPCICQIRTANMIYNGYVIGTISEEQNDAEESDWVIKINWENWEKSGCIPIPDIDTSLRLDEYIFEDIPTFVEERTLDSWSNELLRFNLTWNDRFEYMCKTKGLSKTSPITVNMSLG